MSFTGSLINDDDSDSVLWRWARLNTHNNASGWNAYRGKIVGRQGGNRSRSLEVVMDSLMDGGE